MSICFAASIFHSAIAGGWLIVHTKAVATPTRIKVTHVKYKYLFSRFHEGDPRYNVRRGGTNVRDLIEWQWRLSLT